MVGLIETDSISRDVLQSIFSRVGEQDKTAFTGIIACSFQGTGTRTRTTFIKALQQLGFDYIDLPVFLETEERVRDLAGYLDAYYDLYIIRYSGHEKLKAFAGYSKKPVINAMSAFEHPCEAIADAYWFDSSVKKLESANIVLWGPMTNVLRSWKNVAEAGGARVSNVTDSSTLPGAVDLVVTDAWPPTAPEESRLGLEIAHLREMGNPVLLPTPPFTVGEEILFDPLRYDGFAGYSQKRYLLDVQKAIILWAVDNLRQQGGASDAFGAGDP